MATWYPESSADDGSPGPSDHSDQDLLRPGGRPSDSAELPTRRTAQAVNVPYDTRGARSPDTQYADTQYLPPATAAGSPPGDYGGLGRGSPPYGAGPATGSSPYASGPADTPTSGTGAAMGAGISGLGGSGTPPSGRRAAGPVPPGDRIYPPAEPYPSAEPYPPRPTAAPYGADPAYADPRSGADQHHRADSPYVDPPLEGVAGLAASASAAPQDADGGRARSGQVRGQAPGQSLSRMLAALAWPVTAIGLFIPESGSSAFGRIPAWSAFALACLVLVGIGAFGGQQGPGQGRTWTLGVVGACGLVTFWVLLVLPVIGRNTSFALTLGTAAAVAGVWLTPGRRRG
jgi:hypothetical protein